jgi:SAM-dependent methyltransferase
MNQIINCPICDQCQGECLIEAATDYITGDIFQLWECKKTGVRFTYPRPGAMDKYYPLRYRQYNPTVLTLLRLFYQRRIHSWLKEFPTPGYALEVGCGDGTMISLLREAGWRVVGSERSLSAAHEAGSVRGLPIFVGNLDVVRPCPTFDLIILFQVLEHIPDPETILKQCVQLLKPNGMLIVGVPNQGSWQAQIFKANWFHLDVPRHLIHFTPESLGEHLRAHGLLIQSIQFFSPEHDPFGWIQSSINQIGFKQNHLTRFLMGIDPFTLSFILQFVVVSVILIPALLITLISWLSGHGAIMEIGARKPWGIGLTTTASGRECL